MVHYERTLKNVRISVKYGVKKILGMLVTKRKKNQCDKCSQTLIT